MPYISSTRSMALPVHCKGEAVFSFVLLAIEGVDTSCGCISVEYSKEPVRPGMDLNLSIIYKAEHPEHFSKTVRIHCNSESSPIILTVSGNAQ